MQAATSCPPPADRRAPSRLSRALIFTSLAVCVLMAPGPVTALADQGAASPGGPIHGVQVLSDQVEDVSSLEAIRAHLAQLDSDETRASELFRLAVKFRHQITPPSEYLGQDNHVHEPVKIFNVYGYCKCCCSAAMMMALWRDNGMQARGHSLTHHSVSEVFYDKAWHLYDLSVINFFIRDDGRIASVGDLVRLGPALANREHSMFIDGDQRFPARAHRLDQGSHGRVYDVTGTHEYEYPYTTGHRISLSLRRGESITRRWTNTGRHVSSGEAMEWPLPLERTGYDREFVYLKTYDPDYRMGLIGNGELVYEPDLGSASWRDGALSVVNVSSTGEDGARPALHPSGPGRAEVVIPFTSSYVFLGGKLLGRFARLSADDTIRVLVSLNHGLDWKEVWSARRVGTFSEEIDLTRYLLRRYQYLIKIEMTTRAVSGMGLESLAFVHDIQHAQRPLPLLREGRNTITVAAPEPALATRTIEASLKRANPFNASFLDFHPRIDNLTGDGQIFRDEEGRGALTFPVSVPGPIRAIRFGGSFRARGPADVIRLLVSDDQGATWKVAETIPGPFTGMTRFTTFDRLAADARRALVRYEFDGAGDVGMFVYRIDVDYTDPKAGVRPVKVTYAWDKEGSERRHEQVIATYPTRYTIDAGTQPVMKWIRVEGM